jgi:hypothetical protein
MHLEWIGSSNPQALGEFPHQWLTSLAPGSSLRDQILLMALRTTALREVSSEISANSGPGSNIESAGDIPAMKLVVVPRRIL